MQGYKKLDKILFLDQIKPKSARIRYEYLIYLEKTMKEVLSNVGWVGSCEQDALFKHPLDLTYQSLESINGVKFTPREIDVMACIISGRPAAKTIASLLSIEPKTVEVYIRNIRLKLGVNSRESIVNFIEKSGKFSDARQHYTFLINQFTFEGKLRKASSLVSKKTICCLIVFEKKYENFIYQLKIYFKHLEVEGIFIIKDCDKSLSNIFRELDTQHINHCILVVSYINIKKHFINEELKVTSLSTFLHRLEDITFISFTTEANIEICCPVSYINFGITENYYISFFDLFKRIFSDIILDNLSKEFKENYYTKQESNLFTTDDEISFLKTSYSEEDSIKKLIEKNTGIINKISHIFKKEKEKLHLILILSLIILIRELTISDSNTTPLINHLQNCPPRLVWCFTLIFCSVAIIILYKKLKVQGLYLYTAIVILISNIHFSPSKMQLNNLLIASTFFISNMLTEFYGRKITQTNIWFSVYAGLFMVALMMLVLGYNPASDSNIQNNMLHFSSIKSFTASLLAFMFSQWLNIFLFEQLPYKAGLLNLWLRTGFSLLIIGFIDKFIFSYLEFSLLTKESIGLWDIVTGYTLDTYGNYVIFAIFSIVICKFFYMQARSEATQK